MKHFTLDRRRFFVASTFAAGASWPGMAKEESLFRVAAIGHTGRGDFGHSMDTFWKRVPGTELVAVSDPVEKGLNAAVKRLALRSEDGFSDYTTMLKEVRPDIVSVCPRHVDQHHAMIMASINSGVRGLYVEKPFCRDLQEADEIIAACKESGTKIAIAHRNRYKPVLPKLRKLIEDGAIGRLLEIRARGKEDRRGGGQDLWVLGSHLLNLAHYFSGTPLRCSAEILQDGKPADKKNIILEGAEGLGPLLGNEIHARYETESGIPIHFSSIQNAGTREAGFGLQLIGTEGIIDLRADRDPLAHVLQGNPFLPDTAPNRWKPVSSAGVDKPEPDPNTHNFVMSHEAAGVDLLESIKEDREPLCNAEQGRVVTEMILGAFASHVENGASVAFPLEVRSNALQSFRKEKQYANKAE